MPSGCKPKPLMWVWVATRCDFVVEDTSSILILPSTSGSCQRLHMLGLQVCW